MVVLLKSLGAIAFATGTLKSGLLLAILLASQGAVVSPPAGTIAGKIQRPDGTPAGGIRVTVLDVAGAEDSTALPAIAAFAETDAAGFYNLKDLPPGRYSVVAGLLQLPTFFPGVMDRKDAALVVLSGEKGVTGIDFRLVSDEVRARTLLASKDAVELAWGAWLAAESGQPAWTTPLEERLAEQLARGGRTVPEEAAIDTLTDALIRLNAKPPASMLESLYESRQTEALILMTRLGAEANAPLLRVMDRGDGARWAAAANVLLANRAPGFVAALLRNLRLKAQLEICGPGPSCPVARFSGYSTISDGPPRPVFPALPPWPTYWLSTTEGDVVLTEGPINVSYIRRVSTEGRNPRGTGSVSFSNSNTTPTATDRLNYIAASAPGVTLGIQAYEERRVVTDDPKAAVQERESFERDILTRYAALLSQLKTAGVLSETEAEEVKTPVLDVKVLD